MTKDSKGKLHSYVLPLEEIQDFVNAQAALLQSVPPSFIMPQICLNSFFQKCKL